MKGAVKKFLIIIGITIITVVMVHAALFTFINIKGKNIILGKLKNDYGLEASIESLSLRFPLNLEIKQFSCELLSLKKINISLGFFNPFTRRVILNQVYLNGLNLDIVKQVKAGEKIALSLAKTKFKDTKDSPRIVGKANKVKKEQRAALKKAKPKNRNFSFMVEELSIDDSRIGLIYPINKHPLEVVFDDVALKLNNFTYPMVNKFSLKLKAALFSPSRASETANSLEVKGWIDYANKDMDVVVNIQDLDYIAFGKSYSRFWQPDNLSLKEAVLSLESNLKSKNNELTIDNLLTLEKISFIEKDSEDEESFKAKTLKTIISYLKGDKDKSSLHFKLITTMDAPELDFSSVKENLKGIIQIKPSTIIERVVDDVKEKISGTGEITIDSVVETLKDTADIIKGLFNIQEEEE